MLSLAFWAAERRLPVKIVFGVDDDTMESVVLQLLRERGLTLGLAESVTGGLVAGRITNVPGSSDVLRGGVVSYASDVKYSVLGVPEGAVKGLRVRHVKTNAESVLPVRGIFVAIGHIPNTGPFAPPLDVDEGGFHTWQHVLHATEIHIAD